MVADPSGQSVGRGGVGNQTDIPLDRNLLGVTCYDVSCIFLKNLIEGSGWKS